jgi:hypothetical protein
MSNARLHVLGLCAFWLVGAAVIVWSGTRPNYYLLHVRGLAGPLPYPWHGVALVLAIQATEAIALLAILRPRTCHRSWKRALTATFLSLALCGLFFMTLMHAPPYVVFHWWWLVSAFLVCATLLILALASHAKSG